MNWVSRLAIRSGLGRIIVSALAGLLAFPGAADAMDLKRGEPLPPISLPSVDGEVIDTEAARGEVILLLFGETGHERTRQAWIQIIASLEDPQLLGTSVRPILLLSRRSELDQIEALTGLGNRAWSMVHDVDRVAFGLYRVVAMPSVVIADREGNVVHAAAGLTTDRFGDVVHDALLVAAGRMGFERLDATIEGSSPPGSAEADLKARRLARVARRLVHAKMPAMAEERYLEAIDLAPTLVEPRLELGHLLVAQGRLSEADHHFRSALKLAPDSLDAACGVALVLARRGDREGVMEGRAIIEAVLHKHPRSPRALYVLGVVQSAEGNTAAAAATFRDATEILLSLSEGER